MKKLIFIILSTFLAISYADPLLLVEREQQQLHFVYPDLAEDVAYYYATWTNKKSDCGKINFETKALILSDAHNKIYEPPTKKGTLCLRHSNDLLTDEWRKYQIMPDDNFSILETDNSRGVGIPPPGDVPDETHTKLLPCNFNLKDDISVCELKL